MAESEEERKSLLMKMKEESEKAGLKQQLKNEDYSIQSHHFMGNNGETVEAVSDFILGGISPKSLQMVSAAMKLKDTYSLEGKL